MDGLKEKEKSILAGVDTDYFIVFARNVEARVIRDSIHAQIAMKRKTNLLSFGICNQKVPSTRFRFPYQSYPFIAFKT